jgi:O-antigen ligase
VTLRRTAVALPLAGAILSAGLLARGLIPSGDRATAFETGASVVVGLALLGFVLLARPAATISLAIALTVFSTHWSDMGVPVSLERVVLVIGIVTGLVRARQAAPDHRLRTRPIHWLLGLAALYALISSIVTGTIGQTAATYGLLDRFGFIPFAMLFVAALVFREPRDRNLLLGTLVALGAYLGLTALFETVGPSSLVIPHYINNPVLGIHQDRARGPFLEAGGNGLALYMCGVASIVAVFTWRDRRWRIVAFVVAALCALGVLFTLTRAIWIGAIAGSVLALLGVRSMRRFLIPALAVGFVLVLGALATVPGLQSQVNKRTSDQSPIWDRNNSNRAAERMVQARPFVGFGWGRFPTDSADYYRQNPNYPMTLVAEVHNVYLSNAAELGLIGGGLWLLALVAAIGGAVFRRGPPELDPWRIGLIGVAVAWGVAAASEPGGVVMPTLLLWTWAGVVRGEQDIGRA